MKIPYARQNINTADIEAVISVLKSDYLTQGPAVPAFEAAVSNKVNSRFAVAVNSATSALHVACLALDLKEGDFLWTTPQTFVASANCALYCGASIDFVDIDTNSRNLCINSLEEKLRTAESLGVLPKIIVTVHLSGYPTNLRRLHELKNKYGFILIEDASHAIGAHYYSSPIGECKYSDCTIFSFHPVKIITSGEGGILTTNNEDLAERMRIFRTHGITGDSDKFITRPEKEIWNFQQLELGFNYRLTDIAAALGNSQLSRLEKIINRRNKISDQYDTYFEKTDIGTLAKDSNILSSMHLYQIELPNECLQADIYKALRAKGVLVNIHYIPVYLHPYYEGLGFKRGYCPNAERFFQRSLSLPMYPELTDENVKYVADTVLEELSH